MRIVRHQGVQRFAALPPNFFAASAAFGIPRQSARRRVKAYFEMVTLSSLATIRWSSGAVYLVGSMEIENT